MRSVFKHLSISISLVVAGIATWGMSPASTLAVAHAAQLTGCAQNAALPTDLGDGLIHGTWAYSDVTSQFDAARQSEGCTVKLEDQLAAKTIDAATYNAASPRQQMLWLFNAERTARSLGELTLDSSLMSQVDLNHSREMAQYGYFNHPSAINHPGWSHVFDRLTINPAINGHWSFLGENIAAGFPDAAQGTYAYMYHDANEGWGHRQNILGYDTKAQTFGSFNWVGIGITTGGKYGYYYSSDFMQSSTYQAPASIDTTAPTLAQLTITCNASHVATVTVTPTDTGAVAGEAGISEVVMSVGTPSQDASGVANTTGATTLPDGTTWSLDIPNAQNINLAAIHVVAVDGSGNYTDVTSATSSCGASPPPPSPTANLNKITGKFGDSVTVSGDFHEQGVPIMLYWDTTLSNPIGSATPNGNYSTTITIGSLTGGPHTLIATAGGRTAQTTFTMAPSMKVTPASGIHTSKPTVSIYGFKAGETISLKWACVGLNCTPVILTTNPASLVAHANGSVGWLRITQLPLGTHQGHYTISAVGGRGSTTTTGFYVTG